MSSHSRQIHHRGQHCSPMRHILLLQKALMMFIMLPACRRACLLLQQTRDCTSWCKSDCLLAATRSGANALRSAPGDRKGLIIASTVFCGYSVSNGPPGWQIVLIFVWVVYTVWLLREERGRQAPGQKIPSNIPVESCVRLHALRARSPDLTVLVPFRLLLGRTYR